VTVGLSADIMSQSHRRSTGSRPRQVTPAPGRVARRLATCLRLRDSAVWDVPPATTGGTTGGTAEDHGQTGKEPFTVTCQEAGRPLRDCSAAFERTGARSPTWLASHKYVDARRHVAPVIAAYVADQFDFLALRSSRPARASNAMQPVRVTSKGCRDLAPASHGRRRHGRDDGDLDLGGQRRPLGAAELPLRPDHD
jgi:hypothetical protein